MSYYNDPYGGYDDEPEDEPPACDDCGFYGGDHAAWCSNMPAVTLRDRLTSWWYAKVYYRTFSIHRAHMALSRMAKRIALWPKKKPVDYDDDIPF